MTLQIYFRILISIDAALELIKLSLYKSQKNCYMPKVEYNKGKRHIFKVQ